MNVELPDGTILEGVPDGTTRAQIMAKVQGAKPDMYAQTAQSDSGADNVMAGFGGVMAGIPLGVRSLFGKDSPGEVDEWKKANAGLWTTPGGKVGSIAGGLATMAPAMFIPGVNTAVGAGVLGGINGLIQPETDTAAHIKNAAVGGVLGGVSQGAVNAVGSALANRAVTKGLALDAQQANNAVRDETLKAAQAAGYSLPPSQVSPSLPNRILEGFAGKLTTAQQASSKNQIVTNNLVRKDLGLPPDAPLLPETLAAVRTQAAETGYAPIRAFGQIKADAGYARELDAMATKYDAGHGGMATLRNTEVENIFRDASQTSFNSANIIEFLRNLREQGFANRASQSAKDKTLGGVQIGIANAIENVTERNLAAAGQAELLQNFRDARKLIAKTFTAERAINPATGNVDASKIGALFRKGKPLSDGMEDVGRTAAAFPAATKEVTTSMPGLSPLDYLGGMMSGAAAGPLGSLAAFARPVVRSAILSGPYQKKMVNPPSYDLGLLAQYMPDLLKSPLAGLLGASQVPPFLGRP